LKSGRKVVKLAGEVSPEFDEEKIHKVRTTIKKMRAIGVWTGRPLKKFFRENYRLLGSIRDVQLAIARVRTGEYKLPAFFTDWLESKLHHLKAAWQQAYDQEKIDKQFRSLEKDLAEKNNANKHSAKFEKEKNEKMKSFRFERPLSDEQVHSGRKTMKEIDFLNKWEKRNSDGKLKQLSDETGNFMDRISAINLLESYIHEETDESKRNEAASLLEEWKHMKEKEKIKLLAVIDSLPG
jgi:hypothetical protein